MPKILLIVIAIILIVVVKHFWKLYKANHIDYRDIMSEGDATDDKDFRVNEDITYSAKKEPVTYEKKKYESGAHWYPLIVNDSQFPDNMNYQIYECHGFYPPTNRNRKRVIEAFGINHCKAQLFEMGLVEPIEIQQLPFEPPTEKQIEVVKKQLPGLSTVKACKYDYMAIISGLADNDRKYANPELLEYATDHHVKLSYYTGARAAYDQIYMGLEERERVAFFIFCVYRYNSSDQCENLDKCSLATEIRKMADELIENTSFMKSLKNGYEGSDLKYFGDHVGKTGRVYEGGSKNTIAYKTVRDKLKARYWI